MKIATKTRRKPCPVPVSRDHKHLKAFNILQFHGARRTGTEHVSIRALVLTLLLIVVFPGKGMAEKKTETLFPERESIKKQAEIFFKEVDTNHPVLSKVDFFASSEAYLSAYLNLTIYVIKNNYLKELLPSFAGQNFQYLEKFKEYRQTLKIENYAVLQKELKASDLKFYLLTLYTLFDDYQNNRLSGSDASTLWNILLAVTTDSYKKGKKTVENAAILEVSSHLVFFKKYKKWQKRARKVLTPIDPASLSDRDAALILKLKN